MGWPCLSSCARGVLENFWDIHVNSVFVCIQLVQNPTQETFLGKVRSSDMKEAIPPQPPLSSLRWYLGRHPLRRSQVTVFHTHFNSSNVGRGPCSNRPYLVMGNNGDISPTPRWRDGGGGNYPTPREKHEGSSRSGYLGLTSFRNN